MWASRNLIFRYISIFLLTLSKNFHVICQELQSEIRIMSVGNCNMSGLLWMMRDISIVSQYPRTYINMRFEVSDEIKSFNKVFIHLERCSEEGFDCEDFTNFAMDRFCSLMPMKNQIWSGFTDRCKPRLRCPLKKTSYEVQNATVEIDAITRFYPDVAKYSWNANIKVTNERDAIVFCGFFKVHIFQYRKRDRKQPKKPKNIL